jgi:hypothetical protein
MKRDVRRGLEVAVIFVLHLNPPTFAGRIENHEISRDRK